MARISIIVGVVVKISAMVMVRVVDRVRFST